MQARFGAMSKMERKGVSWRQSNEKNGAWYWSYALPNGWTAMVTDESQTFEPPRATVYHVVAVSKFRRITMNMDFQTFAEAKQAALRFAATQRSPEER